MTIERTVTMFAADGLTVTARLDPHGDLQIDGQDLKNAQLFDPRATEYEYSLTIGAADIPVIIAGLGEPPGSDVLDALERHGHDVVNGGETAWLRGLGIHVEHWARVGLGTE
jgi:hypothetical protein